jgi:tight adherence protein C
MNSIAPAFGVTLLLLGCLGWVAARPRAVEPRLVDRLGLDTDPIATLAPTRPAIVGRIRTVPAAAFVAGLVVAAGRTVTAGALAGLVVVVGVIAPEVVADSRSRRHRAAILEDLPETVDQLAVVVRAGLGLDAAIARVAAPGARPLQVELARVLQDIRIGTARAAAFTAFTERVELPELDRFVRALVQSDRLGAPVAATLLAQAEELRTARRLTIEERAMRLPVTILAPTVLCTLPALLLVVLGPTVVSISDTLGG